MEEIEALIRSAKDCVRPSDDLRPRVLEAVRDRRELRRTVGYLRLCAVLLIAGSVMGTALSQRWRQLPVELLTASKLDSPSPGDDADWRMVDSLMELRRRQAELLHAASLQPRPKA
jgi:hypothetical protein